MAIQQLASGSSNGIMSFLFQDDGSTDGMVLEGADFALTLRQLLGEYEGDDALPQGTAASLDALAELVTGDSSAPVPADLPADLPDNTPLSTALDTLATDFALPAQSAALPDEQNWEGDADGQEVEQPFWGIAPFTDMMAALQKHTLADTTTAPAAPAAPAAPEQSLVANDQPNAAPLAPVFGSGIQHVIELARDAAQVSTQLTQQASLPQRNPGKPAAMAGKVLPPNYRPAPNTLNQAMAGLHARNAPANPMAEALTLVAPEAATFMPDLIGAEPRNPQSTATPAQTLPHGVEALRANSPLLNQAKAATPETAATGNPLPLQLQSPHLAGTDAWLEDLGTRVDWLKDMNIQKADLQLHPAELGLLEIHISTGEDATTVSFVTHNAAARELIEDSLPRLRELLANQGMQLGDSHVSQHSEGKRREQDLDPAAAAQRDNAAEEPAPVRRTAYMADPNRIDHYV